MFAGDTAYEPGSLLHVFTCIMIVVGLALTLFSIYITFSLVEKENIAPVYVVNLLVSDVIQLCSMIAWVVEVPCGIFYCPKYMYCFGILASVGFMVCVSLERYLAIAWPVWYRVRRTIKMSLIVCLLVWVLPLLYLPCYVLVEVEVQEIIYVAFLLLPFPLLIFFLVGTLKALSAATLVSSEEKQRIVALLVLVLVTYSLLFLPCIIWFLVHEGNRDQSLHTMSFIFQLNPIADAFLYVFLRKGAQDKVFSSCCIRINNNANIRSAEFNGR